jgi:hypothetical protein
MSDAGNAGTIRRFDVRLDAQRVEEATLPRVRTLIRNGTIRATTKDRETGAEQWRLAGDIDELRSDLDSAAASRVTEEADPTDHISRTRLIAYMALAGLVAGGVLVVLAPLCMLIGVFAKFVLSWAAFGAVLAMGITNATRVSEPRIVQLTAAGFAAGGLLAWFLHAPGGDFTPLHMAIIGLTGGAALSYAIRLPMQRAVVVTAAATLLFPVANFAIRFFTPGNFRISLPGFWVLLIVPILMLIPVIPFAAFGGIIGALIDWSDAETPSPA